MGTLNPIIYHNFIKIANWEYPLHVRTHKHVYVYIYMYVIYIYMIYNLTYEYTVLYVCKLLYMTHIHVYQWTYEMYKYNI